MKEITQLSILRAMVLILPIFSIQTVSAVPLGLFTVTDVNSSGNSIDSFQSINDAFDLAIDFDFYKSVTLDMKLNSNVRSPLYRQDVFRNFTLKAWQSFNLMLTGDATFGDTSDIKPLPAELGADTKSSTEITITSATTDEEEGFEFGSDIRPWQIDMSTLSAGDSFRLIAESSSVPIPAAAWLFGSGLIGLFAGIRYRTNNANASFTPL